MTSIYVAGPMSSLPENNYPAFHAAAASLRAQGYVVRNPAEVEVYPLPETREGWMKLALSQLVKCDEIAMLPGWEDSRGARIEWNLAKDLGMPVKYLAD